MSKLFPVCWKRKSKKSPNSHQIRKAVFCVVFSLELLARSLANHLSPFFPQASFYADPNQQGTKTPCFFVQQRFASLEDKIGGRFLRKIGCDLVYLLDYNLPDLQRRYRNTADTLDEVLDLFQYSDGIESVWVRTEKRNWTISIDELHYKFDVHAWCSLAEDVPKMEEMDYDETIKN